MTTMHAYLTMMDRWFFHLYSDAARSPLWETSMWGPGMPAYNDSLTVAQNLQRTYPGDPVFGSVFVMHSYLQSKPYEQSVAEVCEGAGCSIHGSCF